MGRRAVKEAFERNVGRILELLFLVLGWRGYTLELALAEALDRLDGKNNNYIFS